MDAAELKLKLFRKIDALDGKKLMRLYNQLDNLLDNQYDLDEWAKLSSGEKKAIETGLDQLRRGEGRPHNEVMERLKAKLNK